MSDPITDPSVKDPSPVDNPKIEPKEDFVKYSSYQKVLNEKRNIASKHIDAVARVAELESANKERSELELKEQNKFQELLETRDKELLDTRAKLEETNKNIEWAEKMRSFQDSLGHSKIDSAYYSLVPIDEIKYNDDGSIDQDSLLKVVDTFKTTHHRLIDSPKTDLPNQKPGSSTGQGLSKEDWLKLGSKEMTARAKEVDFSKV